MLFIRTSFNFMLNFQTQRKCRHSNYESKFYAWTGCSYLILLYLKNFQLKSSWITHGRCSPSLFKKKKDYNIYKKAIFLFNFLLNFQTEKKRNHCYCLIDVCHSNETKLWFQTHLCRSILSFFLRGDTVLHFRDNCKLENDDKTRWETEDKRVEFARSRIWNCLFS